MKSNLTTLCYIENDDHYLMLHRVKKDNDLNKDKWIGIGGHFEEGESPDECLLREVYEETGLKLTQWQKRGIITFVSNEWPTEYMFLYTSSEYVDAGEVNSGKLKDCDEGVLEWVKKEDVYNLPIWEGDKVFFKLLEENHEFFFLKLRYEGEKLVEQVLN